MATIKFRLSTKADPETGKCEILVRFFHGRIDQYAKSNLFISPASWNDQGQKAIIPRIRVMSDDARQKVAELSDINSSLEQIKDKISKRFVEAGAGKVQLSKTWLAEVVAECSSIPTGNNEPRTIVEVYDKFIEDRNISQIRKNHFKVNKRAVARFLIFQGMDLRTALDSITGDTIQDFAKYLKDEHKFFSVKTNDKGETEIAYLNPRFKKAFQAVPESRLPEERGQNTISEFLSKFREFYLWAIEHKYTTNNPFQNYEIPECIYGTPYYITIEERNRLLDFDLSSRPALETQRDIFVFQCVIGCRVSDLRNLKKSSIIDGAVEYIARKTKEGNPVTIRVPLNSVARAIVEKYKDLPGEKLLPCIADQNYNYAIKEIFKKAGLTRPVTILNPTTRVEEKRPLNEVASSHLARRCFIGNLYKQVKDPNLVGKLSGHKEGSRAFARYRDIDEEMRRELVTMLEG